MVLGKRDIYKKNEIGPLSHTNFDFFIPVFCFLFLLCFVDLVLNANDPQCNPSQSFSDNQLDAKCCVNGNVVIHFCQARVIHEPLCKYEKPFISQQRWGMDTKSNNTAIVINRPKSEYSQPWPCFIMGILLSSRQLFFLKSYHSIHISVDYKSMC